MNAAYKRIVVKIGSNVLTTENGLPNAARIAHLVAQLAALKKQGKEVILVSSGAVASGRSLIKISEKQNAVAARQLLASIGQIKLINTYMQLFEKEDMLCSQVLVTKEDFRDRMHYLNIKNCLEILLQYQVIPIVNENDVVSVTELMFTDNDELAGLIASMLNADVLIILSNVDGIYNGDPKAEGAAVIREIKGGEGNISSFITTGKSGFGRGGMITKLGMAQKVAKLGIPVLIANGTRKNILAELLEDKVIHTRFVPEKITSGKKKWIAHSENSATGVVQLNAGAKAALLSEKASSLLPVGIINISADFKKGDIIRVVDEDEVLIGLGIAEYGSDKARERIGEKKQPPLVHYNYFHAVV
ncbi:glutamate 5-kinase [Pedobacter sp. MC2016-14]|uniref:glutamate 5-kinase n=1 Tax=Pedobacter sp. MC2016-14 TaxID=2897327 RepID=UPI001E506BD8|nr:glutamate 5-kinase [Pedobacter sp. MC2016-14]MCD0488739.1 glutamate 5-kinase [Pedobacter sp. MC2016-14]